MKNKILGVLLILMLLFLSGCETYDAFKEAFVDEPETQSIKIVVFEPLTGKYGTEGNLEKLGVEIANAIYPTVIGRKVELVFIDTQSDITAIKDERSKLRASTQTAIIGSYGEVYSLYLGERIKTIKVPTIAPTSISNLLTKNNEYYFTTSYENSSMGQDLANYAFNKVGFSKGAVLTIKEDESSKEIREQYIEKFNDLTNSKIITAKEYEIGLEDTEFFELLTKMKENGIKSIFAPISNQTVLEVMRQAQSLEYYPLFLGTKQMANDSSFIETAKQYGANIAYCDEEVNTSGSKLGEEFLDKYREMVDLDSTPDSKTALAFDSYMILIKSIEKAYNDVYQKTEEEFVAGISDEIEKAELINAYSETKNTGVPTALLIKNAMLSIIDYEGVAGNITYGGSNVATKAVTITYIKGN